MNRARLGFTILLLLAASSLPAAGAQEVSHPILLSVPRGDSLRLVVDVPVGELEIANSAGNKIEVSGTVTRQYGKPSEIAEAQRIADVTGITIDRVGSRAVVRRQFGPSANTRSGRGSKTHFALKIAIPPGMHLEVHQSAGDVTLAGTFGDMLVRMRVGNVTVKVPKRSVREVIAGARIGAAVADLGDRVVSKEGLLSGKLDYLNEGGSALLDVAVSIGDINIQLTN
jgi:hypothetical protein